MAGFTIPNTPDAYNPNQAEPDSLDFQILGNHTNGVISGMLVTLVSNGIVNVASGEILVNGTYYTSSGGNVNLNAYGASPFFDVIVARVSGGSVTLVAVAGTTDNPRYGAVNDATDVVLAAVWRDSSPTSAAHITDKRLVLRTVPTRVTATSPAGGTTGDLHVRSGWSPSANMDSPLSVNVGGTYYNLAIWPSNNNFSTQGSVTANSLNINSSAATISSAGAITGTSLNLGTGAVTAASFSGNAATATKWVTARTISLTGHSTGSASIDGSGNVSITTTNSFASFSNGLIRGLTPVVDANGTFGVSISEDFYPTSDSIWDLGLTNNRWNNMWSYQVWATNIYTVSLTYLSDAREKRDVANAQLGLDFIKALRPVSYKWASVERDTKTHYGFIAQEVKTAADALGITDFGGWGLLNKEDPNSTQGLALNELISPVVKAIQELANRLEALEAK